MDRQADASNSPAPLGLHGTRLGVDQFAEVMFTLPDESFDTPDALFEGSHH